MGITAELAEFASSLRYPGIPAPVRDNAKLAIIDSIGTIFAGLQEESVRILARAALREAGEGAATAIGLGRTVNPGTAALLNGAAAHALDYDSISLTVSGFVASPTLFAILAVSEDRGVATDGKALIEAFVAGWELEAAIAAGLGVDHYSRGWHATATLGHFGAAVGAAKALGLGTDAIRSAIGVAASEASGLRTMIGNMTNPFHVGKAARNGVTAALLAADGFEAEPDVIEHPYGVAVAFNGKDNFDLGAMTKGLGRAWDLVDPGLVIKVYPCCGLIHSAIDAVLLLKRAESFSPEDVASVEVAMHKLVPPTMKFDRPRTGYEAKFSTPFCIATALREDTVRLEHFSTERTADPAMLALMGRVRMTVHPDLTGPDTFLTREFSEVTIALKDGRELKQRVNRMDNRGSRGNPADLALISAKFEDCIRGHAARDRARQALALLGDLETLDDIRKATELLK